MKHKFYCISIGLVCLCVYAFGQIHDTVRLDSVAVCRNGEYFWGGAKREVFDNSVLQSYASASLQTLLQQNSLFILKSYGNGLSSGVSLRGAGSSQTQISWEGFSLNSITMGDMDISLVPLLSFSSITIDHSGFATNYGSGTFGGVVELVSEPTKQKHTSASVQYTQGSFGTRKYASVLSFGNQRFQSKSTFLYAKSNNNFPYYDYIRKIHTQRVNSEYQGFSVTQTLFAQWNQYFQTKVGVWYTARTCNIPPIMGSTPYFVENQQDTSFKSFISNQLIYKKFQITVKSAYISDAQLYTKETKQYAKVLQQSSIESNRLVHTLKIRRYLSSCITGDAEVQYSINSANVSNYKQVQTEYTKAGILALQYKKSRLQSNISFRKEYNSKYSIPLLYTAGIQYDIVPSKILLRANGGKKFRTPTFNDLYWEQWGNPHLLPERGHTWEIGSQQTWKHTQKMWLVTDVAYYEGYITNRILWIPQGAQWHPMNVAQATIQVLELRAKTGTTIHNVTVSSNIGFDYNNSHIAKINSSLQTDEAIGHRLYYVPKYALFLQPAIQYKSWNAGVHVLYNSKRYYSIGNTMNQYAVLNAHIEYSLTNKKITSVYSVSAQNITNTVYESVRSYPLPGRYLECKIQFLIN